MGVLSRAWWEKAPTGSKDVVVLRAHGQACATAGDGAGVVRTAWRLWTLAGLQDNGADEMLRDGYRLMSTVASAQERVALLAAWFDRLLFITPPVPMTADLAQLAPEHVRFARAAYGSRAFAGQELLAIGLAGLAVRPTMQDDVYRALRETHPAFLTAPTGRPAVRQPAPPQPGTAGALPAPPAAASARPPTPTPGKVDYTRRAPRAQPPTEGGVDYRRPERHR